MSIKTVIESGVVVNTVSKGGTLDDIMVCLEKHVNEWTDKQILWDLRKFTIKSLYTQSIHSFISKIGKMSQKRQGQRTAVLVNSETAYRMLKMFKSLAGKKIKAELFVFRKKTDAMKWLAEE